jgi:hypothetical protein
MKRAIRLLGPLGLAFIAWLMAMLDISFGPLGKAKTFLPAAVYSHIVPIVSGFRNNYIVDTIRDTYTYTWLIFLR